MKIATSYLFLKYIGYDVAISILFLYLIILLGARLNWMLHFGKSPRFREDVKIVQVSFFIKYFDI